MHNDVHVQPDKGNWKVSGIAREFATQQEAEKAAGSWRKKSNASSSCMVKTDEYASVIAMAMTS